MFPTRKREASASASVGFHHTTPALLLDSMILGLEEVEESEEYEPYIDIIFKEV